jgi:hypothetical protein
MADNFERLQGGSESSTEKTLKKVKAEWRKQWEEELLSDEACEVLAKKVWPGSGIPREVTQRGTRIALQSAVASLDQKGGE